MADEKKPTPAEMANDKIGRAIDGQIHQLEQELASLDDAKIKARREEITGMLDELRAQKAVVDKKRPQKKTDPTAITDI